MSKGIRSEGKYTLNELSITTPSKKLDLTPYASRVDIYESILAPSVILEIIVSDSTGLLSSFNFTEESLRVSFTTHDSVSPIDYTFKVIEVSPAKSTPNDRTIVFVMTGISEEVLKSKTIKNLPLIRKDIESENVVKALLDLTETKKNFFAEKTKGTHSFGLSNITPFDAIDQVRRNAISNKFNGSAFVFFENKYGYNFKSLEKIIEEGINSIGDKVFVHSTLAGVDVTGTKWRNIIAYKTIQNGNQNVALQVGGYKNSVKRYNIETGQLEYFEKSAKDVNFLTMNKGSISSSLTQQNDRSKDEGNVCINIYNPDQENNQLAEKQNLLPYYISQFLTIVNHATIYGDSTITAGDIVSCKFPQQNGLTQGANNAYAGDDKVLSGNYLICKCRHVLSFGEFPQYFQALEIVKDGISGEQIKEVMV